MRNQQQRRFSAPRNPNPPPPIPPPPLPQPFPHPSTLDLGGKSEGDEEITHDTGTKKNAGRANWNHQRIVYRTGITSPYFTMATKESIVLQQQEAGSCSDDLPSPLDKFVYIRVAEQKRREQYGSVWRPSSLSPAFCRSNIGRKRMQAASQQSKVLEFADKRRKAVPVSATRKPNNSKPVSPQKPKRKSSAVLTTFEKRLDMYHRLPPDQLVAPPRQTPYNLLQERYAPDPWKVMVICMLLNRTRGKTIKELVEGFFTRYPDAQTACNANLEDMVEYLKPTGLQREKAVRIKKFSCSYLSPDWTYVTELHGVGKYAADAYAIFCAGRVMDVQPDDHKLVDYWKYVCNISEPGEDEESCFE